MSTKQAKKTADGFWSKDEEYGRRLDLAFRDGQPMLVHSIEQDTPFENPKTKQVINSRTKMLVSHLDPFTMRPISIPLEFKTLASPIFERAGLVQEGDFPAVCCIRHVAVKTWNNEATVLEKMCEWPIPDNYLEFLGTGNSQALIESGTEVIDQ